jgi:hypothetical protein
MRIKAAASLPLPEKAGNGFVVLGDEIAHHSSKDGSKLDFPIRRLTLRIDGGRELVLITNDFDAEALAIGQLYKTRWDIELLFRWLKQHLKIRRFIGRCETAIRIQIACSPASRSPASTGRQVTPSQPQSKSCPSQLELAYA